MEKENKSSTWLISYITEEYDGTKAYRSGIYTFNSENPTVSGIESFFSVKDTITFMQKLDDV